MMELKREKLTQVRLKELLNYNPKTGVFTRKIAVGHCGRHMAGKKVGTYYKNKYVAMQVDGYKYYAHRLAFLWMEGYLPENEVDHIDRNKHNNSWENLREVSRMCNSRNCKISITNKTGVTGIHFNKKNKKYVSFIHNAKRNIFLGEFFTIIEAAKARWQAEVKYGFPNCNTTSSAYQYLQNPEKLKGE